MKDRLILWMMLLVVAAWAIPAPEIRSESTETHGYQEKHTGILWPTEGWRTARPDNGGRIPSAKSFTSVLLGIALTTD